VILASVCEILRKCFGGIGQVLEKNFYRLPCTPPLSGRLIGPSHRSYRCKPLVGFALGELLDSCLLVLVLRVSSWSVWSCFGRLCVGFSFCAGCVLGVFLVPGPREVAEAVWNTCCVAAVATGLTGSVHQSDRHRFDRRRPSVSPVQQQPVQASAVRVCVFWLRRLFAGS
jgi:hypothetical protein